jgi:hypothetical protein
LTPASNFKRKRQRTIYTGGSKFTINCNSSFSLGLHKWQWA